MVLSLYQIFRKCKEAAVPACRGMVLITSRGTTAAVPPLQWSYASCKTGLQTRGGACCAPSLQNNYSPASAEFAS